MTVTNPYLRSLAIARLFVLLAFLAGCNAAPDVGRAIAERHCGSCHAFPEPELLPKVVWEQSVLPAMGAFADIYKDRSGEYKMLPAHLSHLRDTIIAPLRTSISLADWKAIEAFYLRHSPDRLAIPDQPAATPAKAFSSVLPAKRAPSFTACVYFDEKERLLFQSDVHSRLLRVFGPGLQQTDTLKDCTVVDVAPFGEGRFLLTNIGTINPGGRIRNGSVESILVKGGRIVERKLLQDGLYRPVQALQVPEGLVVCEFGFMEGALSLFTPHGKTTLAAMPGAIRVYPEPPGKDSATSLLAMFAQGRETIVRFTGDGKGHFRQEAVLGFPPAYGSSYFQPADMDGDGKTDIVYTCGDNADQSPVFKPYHGVYIFRNTGSGYEQVYFQHLDGCYKAVPADLNGDGRKDLAVISFFADFEKRPAQAFVYLLQQNKWQFHMETDPAAPLGRWVCMDVKDVNADGRPDVIAGNMAAKPGNNTELMRRWLQGPEFIVRENHY
ncbi:FG-GAP repeat domain-containing protein [Chitinophaga sp. NPDC101104]|uniref:FG-GAP repeat domain-containing protein n=1 Tax=Chitinophaga sp. NPDC101104 TaxID=3390561 RepID=UPI003D01009F